MNGSDEREHDGTHRHEPPQAMKIAIAKYHRQLLVGCGRLCCSNENCASSGKLPKLTSNEAAARAIICLRDKAQLCEPLPEFLMEATEQQESLNEETVKKLLEECRAKKDWCWMRAYLERVLGSRIPLLSSFRSESFRTQLDGTTVVPGVMDTSTEQQSVSQRKRRAQADVDSAELQLGTKAGASPISSNCEEKELEEKIDRKYSRGERTTSELTLALTQSSHSDTSVALSLSRTQPIELTRSASDSSNMQHASNTSQRSRSYYGWRNEEKIVCVAEENSEIVALREGKSPTNVDAARRCFRLLFIETEEHKNYLNTAMGAVAQLCSIIDFQLQYERAWERDPAGIIHIICLMFELPFVQWLEFIEVGFTPLCKMCSNLPGEGQMALASVWASFGSEWVQERINLMQQAITLRVLTVIDAVGSLPLFTDRIEPLPAAIQAMSILYKATLIKSRRDMIIPLDIITTDEVVEVHNRGSSSSVNAESNNGAHTREANRRQNFSSFLEAFTYNGIELDEEEEVRLARQTPIDAWLVTKTCLPLTELMNSTLSDNMSVQDDFVAYKSYENGHAFSVMPEYSFILTTEVKQRFLYLNNRIRQRSERRQALADAITFGVSMEPYLKLNIRRDNIIRDALDSLAAIAMDNSANFKKQLRIQFDGEQAVDEGGVSKEFYQLITDELFCPDYGMFILNEKTGLYWFNSQCNFCDDEFGLIGLLFGLAIYNNILIDVRFPTLVYVKLLARPAVFDELAQIDSELYNGLRQLLECDDDVESIYNYTFQISYKDVYGYNHDEELIPNGANIPVTIANKEKFVACYADFLLNRSVKRQFDAFSMGFNKVANRGLLRRLFMPDEVEQLVCGVLDLDFDILAQCTKYQNGFTESSQTVKDFWTVAKAMSTEEKKMLLQFITGSDRVPVGGLAKLEVIIARNGDNKERLPTAHTCYNVMLLPDYGDLEITRERITKAISYSRGFGLQ
uniref:HECT-type E3 ubiquitin transferase n=1 Tax=Setaria digitata TaxID=48799 RepID=A0A915Q1Q2_9BILA